MSFPFAEVKILLLDSSIGVFNFSNKIFVIILVDASVSIITLTFWFLILNFLYKGIIYNYYLVNHSLLQILLQLNSQIQVQFLQYYLIPYLGFLRSKSLLFHLCL